MSRSLLRSPKILCSLALLTVAVGTAYAKEIGYSLLWCVVTIARSAIAHIVAFYKTI